MILHHSKPSNERRPHGLGTDWAGRHSLCIVKWPTAAQGQHSSGPDPQVFMLAAVNELTPAQPLQTALELRQRGGRRGGYRAPQSHAALLSPGRRWRWSHTCKCLLQLQLHHCILCRGSQDSFGCTGRTSSVPAPGQHCCASAPAAPLQSLQTLAMLMWLSEGRASLCTAEQAAVWLSCCGCSR